MTTFDGKLYYILSIYLVVTMPLKLETKIQKVGATGTLATSIPKPIVKALGLHKGDRITMFLDEKNRIVIEKSEG
ncbi:MAG: AbrB/MazE/SpoVT family DNA-binding domain-containing protein [Euryarchaeota archaeon]|nr:AbrB/MazE/SpoVT family DNA-binding domain-containing protein [Euryarchaeota archaeon]